MTATPKAYIPRFYSEVVKEVGSPDDCAVCAGLELYDAATLGEGVTRDDGVAFDTIRLRELRDEAGLKPNGGLRLDEIARYLAFLDERAGMPLPRFKLDYYPGHPGGTLRMDWAAFKARMQTGTAVAILLGNPIGVNDAASPLRTVQNSDDYGHAIAVMDGRDGDARVFNALRWKQAGYNGERVPWSHLKQFTEAAKGGDRLFGTASAIAVAVADAGSWTVAERRERVLGERMDGLALKLRDSRTLVAVTTEERDRFKRDFARLTEMAEAVDVASRLHVAQLEARIAELENAAPPDCTVALKDARDRAAAALEALAQQWRAETP